jgi:hypothetical protein
MPPPVRVVSINPNNPMPQIIEVFLFNHYCKIPHFLLAGTDLNTLDVERPAWLLAVGPEGEIGVHLDGYVALTFFFFCTHYIFSARTRRAVMGLSDFYVQPHDSITAARIAFAERCGGYCGGAALHDVPPSSSPPSPVRFASCTGLLPHGYVLPTLPGDETPVLPDDDDDAVSAICEAVDDEYELQVQMSHAKRGWFFCTVPGYVFPTRCVVILRSSFYILTSPLVNRASADFYLDTWFPMGPRPRLRLSDSPDYAIRKAFGYYLDVKDVLRVATHNDDGKYTYFVLNN